MRTALLPLVKRAGVAWKQDHAPYLAAAIAYHAFFSLAPLLIVILAIVGFLYQDASTQQTFLVFLQSAVGADSTVFIQEVLQKSAISTQSRSAFVIGLTFTLVGAIGVFSQLQQAVNILWRVPDVKQGIGAFVKRQLILFVLIAVASILFIASLMTSAILARLGTWLSAVLTLPLWLIDGAHFLLAYALIMLLFATLLKALPRAKVAWKDVWIPALITTALFTLGKYLLGLYLAYGSVHSIYGTAGSFAGLLIWIFYAAQIFLFGVELVKAQSVPESIEKTRNML